MTEAILILVMAEEKWEEADFLREQIESHGHKARILDMGLIGEARGTCDITRKEVIRASGRRVDEVELITDRGKRMPVMVDGGRHKAQELHFRGELSGIISLGGTTGTRMGTSIMKSLPFGIPKLAVSSTAALPAFASKYIGTADITLMHSVVEIAGLNNLMRNVLARAAGAMCGMVEGLSRVPVSFTKKGQKPLIAMTHFGPCEACAVYIRKHLEQKGYQVIGFSAAGIGDRAMESIIKHQDIFGAVIDLAPGGVGEELLGFSRAAGPTRLESAGKKGLPQVIAPCGVNFGSPMKRKYKPEYESRKKYEYDASRTFVRLSHEELIMVAATMAEKLNGARGPVKVVIPKGGWSSVDKRGTYFYDGEADRVFVTALKRQLREDIDVREIDADLETPEFARAVIDAFMDFYS
ncbi:MAG: Tm-1-like ATP-binding domain-containing protein [Desulfobacteraceae bacterium]|nr:MAG: Tm-1-like ATP-binding domain-containing protein [Desulfobacteraceae bacterium]